MEHEMKDLDIQMYLAMEVKIFGSMKKYMIIRLKK
jgi:hypothetical protein